MRYAALLLATLALAACAGRAAPTGPAGVPSSSNVNPETGSRGGSGAGGAR